MSKRFAALLLGIGLFTLTPTYAMDSKDTQKVEEELEFDLKGLIFSALIAFIGISLGDDAPVDVP